MSKYLNVSNFLQIPHTNFSESDFLSIGFWQKNKQAGAELCQAQSELG
jgi:hypothetical protein